MFNWTQRLVPMIPELGKLIRNHKFKTTKQSTQRRVGGWFSVLWYLPQAWRPQFSPSGDLHSERREATWLSPAALWPPHLSQHVLTLPSQDEEINEGNERTNVSKFSTQFQVGQWNETGFRARHDGSMLVISTTERLRQEDHFKLKASLDYTVRSMLTERQRKEKRKS